MRKQLHKSTDIREARLADYALLVVQRQTPKYMYDGWEKNDYVLRSHIVQFLQRARWFVHSKSKNSYVIPILLRNVKVGEFLKMKGVYKDQVSAARYFVDRHRQYWGERCVQCRKVGSLYFWFPSYERVCQRFPFTISIFSKFGN